MENAVTLVDLSHSIEDGMTTYKGLPGPHICDFWSREASAAFYDDGSTFQMGRIDMVANTGTYIDAPFHRYADGPDLANLSLDQMAMLEGIVVRAEGMAVGADAFVGVDVGGKAVLVHTGWDRHWRKDAYFTDHPYLPKRPPGCWWTRARASSASIVIISTIHAPAPALSTPSCWAQASSSASI